MVPTMIRKHFLRNSRPTLMWYKMQGFRRRKRRKCFPIPKAIRAINYHDQLTEILNCQYCTETNFRLENDIENNVYVFTIPCWTGGWDRESLDNLNDGAEVICETEDAMLSRLSPLPKIDWKPETRFKGKTIAEALEKYCKSCLKKHERNYLNCWLRGYSKFWEGWKVKYGSKTCRRSPIADVLEDLLLRKIPFRIGCRWDTGFTGFLVNKDVSPSRLQVDEYNNKHQFVAPDELLEVRENDWVKSFSEKEVYDVVKQISYYLENGREKPKYAPGYLERKHKKVTEKIRQVTQQC